MRLMQLPPVAECRVPFCSTGASVKSQPMRTLLAGSCRLFTKPMKICPVLEKGYAMPTRSLNGGIMECSAKTFCTSSLEGRQACLSGRCDIGPSF